MTKTKLFILIIAIIAIALFFAWQLLGYKTNEPDYKVIKSERNIEIREYPALIVAQVQIEGERYEAINTGFKILANYIFGNNSTQKKIAMTAPVIQEGTKIPMTVPVSQQKNAQYWDIRFIMPTNFTIEQLPKPNQKNIMLLEIPEKKYVVIRFSGSNTKNNLDKHEAMLIDYLTKNQLNPVGESIYAFYNPPWILPFLRKNEIMIEIK